MNIRPNKQLEKYFCRVYNDIQYRRTILHCINLSQIHLTLNTLINKYLLKDYHQSLLSYIHLFSSTIQIDKPPTRQPVQIKTTCLKANNPDQCKHMAETPRMSRQQTTLIIHLDALHSLQLMKNLP